MNEHEFMRHLIDHRPVVVTEIRSKSGSPTFRRSVHFSLDAAEKVLQRAERRGLKAEMFICRLVPVTMGRRSEEAA
ncbi:hypothetical protein [Nesterenkonia marinintestina]|uniref:hypothetical protein n=1 Tax=Nesterenkonia marinintestina TaxID=2979865 RepID=UPI0021BE4000|nr:hypothetical protein [Nesterenkonia sp. GX14115]